MLTRQIIIELTFINDDDRKFRQKGLLVIRNNFNMPHDLRLLLYSKVPARLETVLTGFERIGGETLLSLWRMEIASEIHDL